MRRSSIAWAPFVLAVMAQQMSAQSPNPRPPRPPVQSAAPSWRDIEISYGDYTNAAYDHVFDLGPLGGAPEFERVMVAPPKNAACWRDSTSMLPRDRPIREFDFRVRNTSTKPLSLRLEAVGSRLTVTWTGDPVDGEVSLAGGDSSALRVLFRPGTPAKQDLNMFALTNGGKPLTVITFDYLVLPAVVGVSLETANLPSGDGKEFSPRRNGVGYSLTARAVPPMYQLHEACHWLSGDRICGDYSTCDWNPPPSASGGAGFQFTMQGHEKDSDSVRRSQGHLNLIYYVSEEPPHFVKR